MNFSNFFAFHAAILAFGEFLSFSPIFPLILGLIFTYLLIFAESYFDRRAAQFPFHDWSIMPVSAALARLRKEVDSVKQLGEDVRKVSLDIQTQKTTLDNLTAEKNSIDEQVAAASLKLQQAQATHSTDEAKAKELADQSSFIQGQIRTQEQKLADRRARLHALTNDLTQLDSSARRIARMYNKANQNLLHSVAMLGAASLGTSDNTHLLRMAMS